MTEYHEDSSTVVETPFIRARQLHPEGTSQIWHDALVSHPKYHVLAISKINCHTHADHKALLPVDFLTLHWGSAEWVTPYIVSKPQCQCHAPVRKYEEFFDNATAPPWLRLCFPHSPAPYASGMENLLPHSISPSAPSFVSLNGND